MWRGAKSEAKWLELWELLKTETNVGKSLM